MHLPQAVVGKCIHANVHDIYKRDTPVCVYTRDTKETQKRHKRDTKETQKCVYKTDTKETQKRHKSVCLQTRHKRDTKETPKCLSTKETQKRPI